MNRLNYLKAAFVALIFAFSPLALAAESPQQTSQETNQQQLQLDINSADASTIAEALNGIGAVRARDIVAYREMYGDFTSIEELVEVKGIGEATLEKIRHLIVVVSQ